MTCAACGELATRGSRAIRQDDRAATGRDPPTRPRAVVGSALEENASMRRSGCSSADTPFRRRTRRMPTRPRRDALRRHPRTQAFPSSCRSCLMSRNGGAPNRRLYSRLNCAGLSYSFRYLRIEILWATARKKSGDHTRTVAGSIRKRSTSDRAATMSRSSILRPSSERNARSSSAASSL